MESEETDSISEGTVGERGDGNTDDAKHVSDAVEGEGARRERVPVDHVPVDRGFGHER